MSKNETEARLAKLEARIAELEGWVGIAGSEGEGRTLASRVEVIEGELDWRPKGSEFKHLERLVRFRLEAAESDIALLRQRLVPVEQQCAAARPMRYETKMSTSCPGPDWHERKTPENGVERRVGLRSWGRRVPYTSTE